MRRRRLLRDGLMASLGATGAYTVLADRPLESILVASGISAPATEYELRTISAESTAFNQVFDRVVLYQSGAAEVYFNSDHDTDRLWFTHRTHNARDIRYAQMGTPQFKGPVTFNMRGEIRAHADAGEYPSRWFKLVARQNDVFAAEWPFRVPESWLPGVKTETDGEGGHG